MSEPSASGMLKSLERRGYEINPIRDRIIHLEASLTRVFRIASDACAESEKHGSTWDVVDLYSEMSDILDECRKSLGRIMDAPRSPAPSNQRRPGTPTDEGHDDPQPRSTSREETDID